MKRLLKNSIYFAIIAVILVAAARTYEGSPIIGGDEVVWGDFPAGANQLPCGPDACPISQ